MQTFFKFEFSKKAVFIKKQLFLTFIFAFFSFISWNYFGILFLIPLTIILSQFHRALKCRSFKSFIKYFFPFVFIWHITVLFWMFSINKGYAGLFLNLILYLIVFSLIFFVLKWSKLKSYWLIPLVVLFEYYINKVDYLYPWLTIGNSLANQWYIIQWFQYTTVLGGSFWLLSLSFLLLKKHTKGFIILLLIPILFSQILLLKKNDILKNSDKIVTFNPNEYNGIVSNDEIAFHLWENLKNEDEASALLVPELTFRGLGENTLKNSLFLSYIKKIISETSIKKVYIGVSFQQKDKSITNSGILFYKDEIYFRNKRMLVPYTEHYPQFMSLFLKKKKISFNGDIPDDLKEIKLKTRTLPIICYESVFPFYVSSNYNSGEIIYLISSEKFFNGSYFGELQYNNLIRLRAIENSSFLIKASNAGNSFIVNPNGKKLSSGTKEFNYF